MRNSKSLVGLSLGLTGVGLISWWFLPPGANVGHIPRNNHSTSKSIELGTSLHLDDSRSILDNLQKSEENELDRILASPSPTSSPNSTSFLPKALSRIGIVREKKGVIIQYKFKDASEQTKAARAENPYSTPREAGR